MLFVFFCNNQSIAQVKNEIELKKQAEKDFESEEYGLAYKAYSQLVSLYPKDAEYNYRLGVCMLFTEPDKKKPFSYLKIATLNPKEAPKDAKFYLAKTYHVNYKFDEAIKLYNEYKQIGSASSIKKLQVDREIESCKNGKRLLSNLSDLVIISKKQLNEADYFRSYDLKNIGGKLLVKPDDFRSTIDKKKKEKSVMYLPRNNERIYYSSYGENGDNGRDIYFVNKLPNGNWSKPQAMPSSINTTYDEDYPFLHPNGNTLYFSSKGHNSMGGYDVFKTIFDAQTQTWSKPKNLEFPINSPDDDILFVTDSLEKQAFFSTGRYSPYGKIDVLKISTERRPMDFAFVKGTVVKENVSQSLKSKIIVKNMANGEIVGSYQAQDNGDYTMEIPNGGKFIFTVETPGIPTQSEGVQIPVAYSLKPYKQIISYDNKKLKIINYFDGQLADENYSVMLDLIEKKARLEVNENEPYNSALKNQSGILDTTNLKSVNTTIPTVNENNGTPKNNTNKNVTNEQLLSIAKVDAKEANDEAKKLKQEALDAFGLATQKTAEAVELEKKANIALANANGLIEEPKRTTELNKANDLKAEAKIATDVANTAMNMAKRIEVDANSKQKEADLTNEYIKNLEEITKNKNNKEALAKLEKTQKELDDLSKQKNQSDELFESLKAESNLKQNELASSEKKTKDISTEINIIKNEQINLEKDLANEQDKSLKENIGAQIKELKNDIEQNNIELEINNKKIEKLTNELVGINKEIEIAAKILNEKTTGVAVNTNIDSTEGAVETNPKTVNDNANSQKFSITELSENSKKTIAKNATTKNEVSTKIKELNDSKKEVENLISINKVNLEKTKAVNEKKKLNDELNSAAKLKNDIDAELSINQTKLNELTNIEVASNAQPLITNNTNSVAVNNVSGNSEANFNSNNTSDNLLNEAEVFSNKAVQLRNEANNKNGVEKDNLIKEAIVNEKNAVDKKLQASVVIEKDNKLNFEANQTNLENLEKLSQNKKSENITQAKILANESQISFKQAAKLRNEANTNSLNSAKLGGLSNAEEKEAEALSKQKKSIDLLTKENPSYQIENLANKNENQNPDSNKPINTIEPLSSSPVTNEPLINNNISGNDNVETANIRNGLNNSDEANLKTFNFYLNSEAIELKNQALTKINEALKTDTKISNQLDKINSLAKNESSNNTGVKQEIINLNKEADKLNEEAFKLRQIAATKTGAEKEKDLANAKQLESEAVAKKINVAKKQETNNLTQFDANKKSIDELQKMAVSKKNNELENAISKNNEINATFNKAKNLRKEANNYPTDAAKLGGFSNAEEKENNALAKQVELLNVYKKYFPDYVESQQNTANQSNEATTLLTEAKNNLNTNNEAHVNGLTTLAQANEKEYKSRILSLSENLTQQDIETKSNAQSAYKKSQALVIKAGQTADLQQKKELLIDANKNGQESINLLQKINANNNNTIASTTTPINNVVSTASNTSKPASNAISSKTNTPVTNSNSIATKTNTPTLTNGISTNAASTESGNTSSNASIDAVNIKKELNNEGENNLKLFNDYNNSEAINLRKLAIDKISEALIEDKNIEKQLDDVAQIAKQNKTMAPLNQNLISQITNNAEALNDEAFKLRQGSVNKTGEEKEKDLAKATQLENEAVTKKTEAAKKQEQLNTVIFETNSKSLEELKTMAVGKNIAELSTANMKADEAILFFNKGKSLREETKAYPSETAKLGGYGNAEEKENIAIAKQEDLLKVYQKYFSNYVVKKPSAVSDDPLVKAKMDETKKNVETANLKHIDGLTTLAQANEKEYKSRLLSLNQDLNPNQTQLKTKAQLAYKKSQELLNQANQASNSINKKNGLIESNKSGQESISLLSQITSNVSGNTEIVNNNNAKKDNNTQPNNTQLNNTNTQPNNINEAKSNQSNTNTPKVTNNNVPNNNKESSSIESVVNTSNAKVLKVEGLLVKTKNAYTDVTPIPIDEKIQDGLIFKVQIGAFKQPLPNNTFKGLSPVIAQTTPSGYLRYMAGNFEKYESANAVKNDLRKLGYTDAFVVVYFNGVRINLNEGVEKAKATGQIITITSNTSAGLTQNSNIPKNSFVQPIKTTNDNQPVDIIKELEQINGLLYTIQIGVYNKEVSRNQLFNLKPIYTEKLPNGLYRYTAGIYNQPIKLLEDKQKVINLGVKDAFVSAYYNAKRISFADGKKLQLENQNIKMESENPINFQNNTAQPLTNQVPTNTLTTPANIAANNTLPEPTNVIPFNNGVTTGPIPTTENGVKVDEAGISYKVQIGAYKNQVPNDVAAKFSNIKTWPVNNNILNGLFIYTIGNYNAVSFAKKLRDEAVTFGIADAFIVVYKDGKKLYGNEAAQYLMQSR